MTINEKYHDYVSIMQRIADVKYASAVLQWDQETYLPPKGADGRSRQLATLSELAHQMFTNDKLGNLLSDLNDSEDLNERQKKNIALSVIDYNKSKKFSSHFVKLMSECVSTSFHAWIQARKDNSYKIFQPALSKLIELKRQEAEILGYSDHPYNALMNDYERGLTVAMTDKIFSDIEQPLSELLVKVQQLPRPDDSFLYQHFPKQQQWEWGQYLARQLGFDEEAGRQDISEHPFTINFSSKDVRITTRIDEHDFANMTWSTIHEVGHALYEQGLPDAEYGLPLGEYASLSIHESQSRLWENCIGRGRAFWEYYYPGLQKSFPKQFGNISLNKFFNAINKVCPSLIRTEADELTYHFHVMIRYELEKLLIEGSLKVEDIPFYWNQQYKSLLGVEVPDDKQGCLQDVHWSHGSFGYFPTYSMGSFYAAQLWEKIKTDLPNVELGLASSGSTKCILQWLRNSIHFQGRFFSSEEVCKSVTGQPLDSKIFLKYMERKLLG